MKGEKLIYKETYKLGDAHIRTELNPTLPHLRGFTVTDAYLLAAGSVERKDGTRAEYQDIRVYLTEETEAV